MDINIIDLFDLNDIDIEFIEDFRNMKFENIFKENINEYINKIFSKIKKISDFQNVIKLINIKNIGDKNIYFNSLEKTYDKIIKKYFEKKLENYQILARLTILFFKYEDEKNKFQFIENKIKKLDKDIIPKIFIEIMRIYINQKQNEEDEYEYEETDDIENRKVKDFGKIKDYIFEQFINLKEEKDVENIMSLIECLEGKDGKINEINDKNKGENKEITNEFLDKLLSEKNLAKKEEFFLDKNSLKILLLSKLNEKRILQKNNNEYYNEIENLMRLIKQDLDGEIKKKTLDEFLTIEDSILKNRLSLLGIIFESYNPNDEYYRLKEINKKINEEIDKLIEFKNNIMIYHRETYKDKINEIMKLIKDSQYKKINDYNTGKLKEIIKGIEELNYIIDKVKNNLLFNVIYENMNLGNSEEEQFNNAVEKLDNIVKELKNNTDFDKIYCIKVYKDIFDKVKEKLGNNEKRVQEFINYDLKKYFGITNNDLIKDLNILFKIKKYEMDIKSIIFFFDFFQKDNSIWNQKINKTKFENLFNRKENRQENEFKNIKKYFKELKDNEIYDYENIQNYNKFFACFYDKKGAIDFLLSKMGQNIEYLYDRIQPTERAISIADIKNTEDCISTFYTLKKIEDNFKIFIYIKNMNENQISKFENYSKIYSSLIELDTLYDETENLYDEVKDIIKDKTFNIYQDEDDFNLEDLIHLKNKINIKNENIDESKKIIDNFDKKQLKLKCKIMIFYKNLISNLEVINDNMKFLRMKGNSLPIKIIIKTNIKDNKPSIKYYLDNRETEFKNIKSFLQNVTSNYISQLNESYKGKTLFRYLYGKQLRDIMKHIESNFNIDSLLRFILNKSNNEIIQEGFKTASSIYDYIDQYEKYSEYSLESISHYICSVFQNNGITIEDHYKNMEIIKGNSRKNEIRTIYNNRKEYFEIYNNNCKGIYIDYCNNHSMERYILNLYWDNLGELPMAQNILIANKETSSEEIQAFFHRAILCHYNILFIVEITDSFSDYQQSIMNSYIDDLLSYKHKYYIEETKEHVNIKNTEKYLDSCIFFIYNMYNENITTFLKGIKKYENKKVKYNDRIKYENHKFLSDLGHIIVITSDLCGLGKSEIIKKKIKDENKKYYYFPLGGILTKDIIFKKLDNLLKVIKKEKYDYRDVAIHLDLSESNEITILNEFFFSFLITKFYINNGNVIYISKDIYIYIEIPNCFENYLSKFDLLNIFKKESIAINNMPPFNYSKEVINIFERILGINSNDGIKNFVEKYFNKIGIEKYTYYQIDIFIKLFISQFKIYQNKLIFRNNNKEDETEKYIEDFSKCTKYFINGRFCKLLTEICNNNDNNRKDYISKLSEIYDNDLMNMEYPEPLIFINCNNIDKLYIHIKDLSKNSKDYMKCIKEIFNLPNEVEKDVEVDNKMLKSLLSLIEKKNNKYALTNDNFKKMILLIYRIKANVPVILMGENGCGKTALIIKLNQIFNNGEIKVKVINIHPGITDEKICNLMEKINELAERQKDEELWIFFDEMNICPSLSLLTEIFTKRTYNGKKLNNNIRLIGACSPYRSRRGYEDKCGLSKSDNTSNKIVYSLQPFTQSLLYYVFIFGRINDIDEKKYIYSIIEKLFKEDEKYLHDITTEVISECHKFLRTKFYYSIVSLRDISRFSKCMEFFQRYFTIKNENEERYNNSKNNKIRSII